jgi:putative PIN family toxin of toxin-antitoxin system
MAPRVVLDTNVLVSAVRSRRGASFRVLQLVGLGKFEICISVPLVLEYESALKKVPVNLRPGMAEIDAIIDYLCMVGERHKIYYLWRPHLRDAKDDMVLELAVTAQSDAIITYNKHHFLGANRFGLSVISPRELLDRIGDLS